MLVMKVVVAAVVFAVLLSGSSGASMVTGRVNVGSAVPRGPQGLAIGDNGPRVLELQQRLIALGYRPGSADGRFGPTTASAVLAFQKRQGLRRTGNADAQVLQAMIRPSGVGPGLDTRTPRIAIDLLRQVVFVVLPGRPVITLNASTGTGKAYRSPRGGVDVAYTPVGSFVVQRKILGDERAPLGILHNPMYFYKGWAIHGSTNVPSYPASHGCVRISNADSNWLFPLISRGTPVVVYDGSVSGAPKGAAPGP
jgi:peptidoglycan hydrolase-like protein with peptidoglycan-binding domain